MKRLGLPLAFALTLMSVSDIAAQGLTQMNCAVQLDQGDNRVRAFVVVVVSQPTKVEWRLRMTRIGGVGNASTETSGSRDMDPGRAEVLGSISVNTGDGGLVEFELDARERLTGATCTASETVSPF